MFGWLKAGSRPQLSADEVAAWLAQHARDVRASSVEDAMLFARTSLALSHERERRAALVEDVLRQ